MSNPWGVTLTTIDLPEFELPREMPEIPAETYAARVEALYAEMDRRGLDAVAVYGDREHFANTAFLTGFDPRYEESLLIFVPGRTPTFLVGNESVGYASKTPYPVEIIRQSKFSLVGQPDPDDVELVDQLAAAGLGAESVRKVGLVGWKYWTGASTSGWIDVPHFIVSELATLAGELVNATDIFTDPDSGLRLHNDVDQLAYFEFAASHGSQAMRRLISGIRPGMTELEASSLMNPIMLPFNYHPTMLSGDLHTSWGVASPTSRVMSVGERVCAGLGYWGSNTARAGYLAEDASQIPADQQAYVEKIVAPYYATAAAWYETIRIGLTAGELYDVTASRIGDPYYGVFLNPGHSIHLDEWPVSAVKEGSTTVFTSGNALQLDIIPGTVSGMQNSQIEDGIILADDALQASLTAKYPAMMARVQQRRDMLANVFGITLHESVLPLSNTAGYLPPFWLSPTTAMVRG
ncbi:hypothetical protein QQX10_07410 [Demequina sp. SYSU T00039]|uniref:Creatinase N-terminal domain-containing protein n=1 Tax=Demequina lignilytica TaxID=3051663 RepID=A0AAW7M0T9_9MICO|nr:MULTISPECIES: aminopeptidase P family N-terminal domain-containing protein [unclassified Demequina]MDN4477656.1 hypothetical protein [Demequina sp. SYSU T00039-1]MDN4487993.1 hypothetical protein [Demequina sp. SYSU T00039]MDN4490433.1 hypothetical protein [Demequina sp. SYSU T00068]